MAKPARKLKVVPGGKARTGPEPTHYQVLFENANDAIVVIDLDKLKITSANNAALDLTGFLKDELEGQDVKELFPGKIQTLHRVQSLSKVHVQNSGFFEELAIRQKDDLPRFVSLSTKTFKIKNKPVAMCILRDVGEKKNMEREIIAKHSELRDAYMRLERGNAELKSMQETLVQSGKLAALGELAAGIAHELNQPLTAVKGFAQEAKAELKTGKTENVDHFLEEVISGADKMRRIITHLRNFTRKSTEDFKFVDIHQIIDESMLMLEKQLDSRGIKVEKDYGDEVPEIYCNPFQIEQVFINLFTNARDAIDAKGSGSGLVQIKTRKRKGKMLEVEFKDDGVGISKKAKDKIFNPFFTTKEVGKGMGLGLSISYGILSRINASILVESEAGKGTKFNIRMPVDYREH